MPSFKAHLASAVIALLAISLVQGLGLISTKSCALDVVLGVPNTNIGTQSQVSCNALFNPVIAGNLMIDGNMWGLSNYEDSFEGTLVVRVDEKGYIRFKAELDLSKVPLKTWNVVAYPEISYGLKPWTPGVKPQVSTYLPLPLSLSKLPRAFVLVDYAVASSSTSYNVAFDIWILKGTVVRTPREGDVEVMIWLHRHGTPSPPNPAGRKIDVIYSKLLVDGTLLELPFEVWLQNRIGEGWTYIAFVLAESKPYREVGLDLTFFLEKVAELLKLDRDTYSVFSVEFGFELFYNPKVTFEAAVYKYVIVVTERAGIELLQDFTPRSKRLIAWIVPWGYPVSVDDFNANFTPGVIVAYDVECGLCTSTLQAWFRESTRYIGSFRKRGGTVFVNIFPEKYHPEWRWRGELGVFKLNETVLEELKRVIGDGEGVYIGFSELKTCVNDEKCRSRLVEAYRTIRSLFPASRLYYYGSGGEDVNAILDLYLKAGLDIVGLDVWDYEYTGGRVLVARYIAEKIAHLGRVLPDHALIIGEVGFRLNDKESYVEAWNKHRRIVYEKGVHVTYYTQVVEHLFNLAKPSYLGIWSWNDEVFSISRDTEIQRILIEVGETRRLLRSYVCEKGFEELPRSVIMEHIALIVITGLCIGLLLTVYFYKKSNTVRITIVLKRF